MSLSSKQGIVNSTIILSFLLFQTPAFGTHKVSSSKSYTQASQTEQSNQDRENNAEQSSQKADKTGNSIEITEDDGGKRLAPIITGGDFSTIILTAMYGTVVLLVIILFFAFKASKNLRENDKNPFLSEALPLAIEGVTIVYIVVAVLLFGVLGITSAEGSLSILSAISGYVLGKSQGQKTSNKTSGNELNKLPGKKPNSHLDQNNDKSSQDK